MIPHHDNAVNMAKLLMKADVLDAGNDPDGDIDDLLWDIVSVQPHQIHTMERWLASNGYGRSARCEREQDGCAAFKKKRKCLKDGSCRWKKRTCQAKKTDKCPPRISVTDVAAAMAVGSQDDAASTLRRVSD